ncbi:hypothetical protein X907_2868 [Glycocaulis alkaliphilus]|uniref:Uncharacterized protein n=1 Tax=Glycocaulis alkaliphilus TaxID=1434191 RepID=A0A3T0EDK1_9PROT|nr:hypothetical protein [Glycocaulis alkaliphilus]AZU05376.1 hypothetical protein X907_2868 [Glycocaulis alkaliphilus]GGB81168.1 hypothetical protein GCM10007417_21360 [Glycocaulis alkaliphilus]
MPVMETLFTTLLAAAALALAGPPPPAEDAAPSASDRVLSTSSSYVRMEPVSASVRAGAYMGGVLEVQFSLNIPDEALREHARASTLRLRDGYVTALTSYGGLGYRAGDVPDFVRITRLLQQSTDRTLGARGAEVLIRSMALHEP